MKVKGSNKSYGRKHVPKMEYGSELSVSDMEDLGENIIDNADRKACEQFNVQFDSYVKFHDVDDSIKLLIDFPHTEFIS